MALPPASFQRRQVTVYARERPMTKRRGVILVLLATLGLAGCVSSEELRREDEAQCASYGFVPQTPDFATCLQRESMARRSTVTFGFGFSGGF